MDIHDGFAFFVEGLDDEALEAGGFDFEDAGVDVFPVLEAFGFCGGEGGFLAVEADFDLAAAVFGSAALGDGDAVATGFAGDEFPFGEVGGVGPEAEAVFFGLGFVTHDFGPGDGGFGLQGDAAVVGEVDGFGAFFGGDEGDLFDVEHGGGAGGGGVHGEGGGVGGGEVDFTEVDLGGRAGGGDVLFQALVADFELNGQAGAGEGVGDADGVAAPAGGFEGGPVELVPVGHGGVDEVFGAEFDDTAGGEVGAFDGFVTAEAVEVDGRRGSEDFIGG